MVTTDYQTEAVPKLPIMFYPAATGTSSAYSTRVSVNLTYFSKTFTRDIILEWKPSIVSIGEGQMIPKPESLEDKIDRQIDAMTDDERLSVVMAMAGTWTHLEEDDGSEWGWYDWDAPDDLPI